MLEAILEYQKKDGELVKIEKEISESKAKKVVNQMVGIVKDAQQKIVSTEKNANVLIKNYEELSKSFLSQQKLANNYLKLKLETEDTEVLAEYEKNIKDATTNILVLQKNIAKLSKNISETLKQFEQYKNEVIEAKKKHAQGMSAYQKLLESRTKEIESLKKELLSLEKKVEPKLLAKYKKMREDKKFPIFVPLLNNSCGGCSMGLAVSQVNKLEEKGMLECENCHRIIYKK